MALTLSRHSFLALAAVGWADGRLAKDEALALLRTAEKCGLAGEDLAAIEHATRERVEMADIDTSKLTSWESALTFAIASWLARLDGVVKPDEQDSLRALGKQLGLTDKSMQGAASAAFDVAMLASGSRPEKYDFAALETRLRERLPTLAKEG
jgi:hypothetical protein